MQTDPIGYGDGMNIYAYVRGDPVNGSDPTGTDGNIIGELVVNGLRQIKLSDASLQYRFDIVIGRLNVWGVYGGGPYSFSVPIPVLVVTPVTHKADDEKTDDDKDEGGYPEDPREGDLTKVKPKDVNSVAEGLGYNDAHEAKEDLGRSRVNLFKDKNNNVWVWDGKPGSDKIFIGKLPRI